MTNENIIRPATLNLVPAMNYQLFKIDLDTIPLFEGKETQLNIFLTTVDSIIQRYANYVEVLPTIRAAIFSKFRGRAADILGPRDDLMSWNQIKDAILQHFSDSRSLEQLLIEFNNLKLEKNENIVTFGHRIRVSLAKLISKINLSNLDHKNIRQEIYITNALDRFLVSIPYEISCQVRLRQPFNLDQAIIFANDEINFRNRSIHFHKFPTQNTSKPTNNSPMFKSSNPPQQNFTFKPHQNNFSNNFRPPFQFVQQNRSPTQTFNRPTFFKPPSNQMRLNNKQMPPPEPMSVQTTLNVDQSEEQIQNEQCTVNQEYYTENYFNNYHYAENPETNYEIPENAQEHKEDVNFTLVYPANHIT